MGFKYRVANQEAIYFITSTVVGWIDVFTRRELAEVIVDSLAFCQTQKGLIINAWCLMPNHLHMVASSGNGGNFSDIMRDFKTHTSKKVISTIKKINESRDWMVDKFEFAAKTDSKSDKHKFWQSGINYIHQNPVKAGLVTEDTHYRYSSAIDYQGGKGLLDVALLV